MKKFLIALQFLTILPIKIRSEIKERDFGASLVYFPVVGALIGLLLVLILFSCASLQHLVKAALVLTASIIVTGALHLDGFADTCDGFYGAIPRERRLEIMRDSRLGVMGVIGIVVLLLLKFSLIAALIRNMFWQPLIVMTIFARWAQVLACYLSGYARKTGKAKYFIEYAGEKEIFVGALFTLTAFLLLMQIKGIVVFFVSALCITIFINYIKKKIKGMTGDTIGAVNELGEITVLMFSLMLLTSNI